MAHQDVTDTVQIDITYGNGDAQVKNIMHAMYNTPMSYTELDDLAAAIVLWLTNEWADIASSDWSANSLILTDLGSLTGPRKSYAISPDIPGTVVSESIPPNATLAVKADVGHRGRGIQGRVFWVGLAESQVAGFTASVAVVTLIEAALNTLNDNIAALAAFDGLCIPHRVVGGVRPPVATSELVTTFLVTDNIIDSQRDRLPNHKRKKRAAVAP